MRKTSSLLLWLAWLSCCSSPLESHLPLWKVEGKVGAFIPTSKKIRQIFAGALPFFEAEASCRFAPCWDISTSVGYMWANGHSLGCRNPTFLQLIPLSITLHRFFRWNSQCDLFLGVGGIYSFYRNNDASPYVHQHISEKGGGARLNGAIAYRFTDCFKTSLVAEYIYQRFSSHRVYERHFTYRHAVDMSGVNLAIQCGYLF